MTVVVVGYGPGISHATAARFGATGQAVALIGRTPERLDAGVERLAADGVMAGAYPADASRPDALREVLATIRADHGRIGTIIWTAFRNGAVSDVLTTRPADLAAVFQVGVVGLLTAVQTCLDDLRATPGAAVLVANGSLGEPEPQADHFSAVLGGDGTALENAAKSKLVGLLAERLRPDGVYVGQISIAGTIAGTATASPTAIDPRAVAERFWQLAQERDTSRTRLTETAFELP